MQLITEIRVTVQLGDMSVRIRQTNLGIGHDRVEVAHQIVLRHHRQLPQVIGVKRGQVHVPEPIAMPGGPLHSDPDELAELGRSLGAQPLSRPRHPLEMLAYLGQQVFNMTLARCLIGLHSMAPYKAPTRVPASRHAPQADALSPRRTCRSALTQRTQPCWILTLTASRITYMPLANLPTATEKARRDAPAISVCEV